MSFRNNLYPPTPCITIAASNKPSFVSISGANAGAAFYRGFPNAASLNDQGRVLGFADDQTPRFE